MDVRHGRVRLHALPRVELHKTEAVRLVRLKVSHGDALPREARVEAEVTRVEVEFDLTEQLHGFEVVQLQHDVGRGLRSRVTRHGRHPQQTLGPVGADLSGQRLVRELDVSVAKHPDELVDAEIEQPEVRVGVARQVKHNEVLSEAQDALDAEVVDRRHLRRDVVVLKVFGHLGELAASSEAEDGVGAVDADDALPTHAEREVAVLVQQAATCEDRLGKPRRLWRQTQCSI